MLATSQADPGSARTNRLYHRLESLPPGGAPFSLVEKLVIKLIRRNPISAYKYVQTAIRRIAWHEGPYVSWSLALQKRAANIAEHSDLPLGQKEIVIKNINRSFQDLW